MAERGHSFHCPCRSELAALRAERDALKGIAEDLLRWGEKYRAGVAPTELWYAVRDAAREALNG